MVSNKISIYLYIELLLLDNKFNFQTFDHEHVRTKPVESLHDNNYIFLKYKKGKLHLPP